MKARRHDDLRLVALWLTGLIGGRSGRLLGAVAGVALTVALIGCLGAFTVSASRTMARRAVANVTVDWQLLLTPDADPAGIAGILGAAVPVAALRQVGYADAAGFTADTGGTVQTTGPGKVLGIDAGYPDLFPDQMRLLLGSFDTAGDGALIAEQTAANLHVSVGGTVSVERDGRDPLAVRIAGVVALPNADQLFQAIGVPKGIAPQAPPDNVVILPLERWRQAFGGSGSHRQLHVRLDRRTLPPDPVDAFVHVRTLANNVEARTAGSAVIGDNLAARLDAVRSDALYARVLFLFLGMPGVILAALLTTAVTASGAERRRREQALLRTRGASLGQILALAGIEAAAIGIGGLVFGTGIAVVAAGAWGLAPPGAAPGGILGAAAAGLLLALAAVLLPAWRDARCRTVASARSTGRPHPPLWQRLHLDLGFLALAALVYWRAAGTGYRIVLAPEGVAETSVHYEAFLAPLCLWIGAGLLAMRLTRIGLDRGRRKLAAVLKPAVGDLSATIAASLARQRDRIARNMALVAVAFAFATSTAVFNATWQAQARVDAELTNGADVTVTGAPDQPASPVLQRLKALPGVRAAQPMMHRFAYVGSDLQDLYGIDPAAIGEATAMSDAWFATATAAEALDLLRRTRDGVLVSDETVRDFQLQPGDTLNLRIRNAADHRYRSVAFRFIGIVREFPTAPKDSFLVANAAYLAEQTGSDAAEIVLLRTSGDTAAAEVASAARRVVATLPGLRVGTIGEAQALIASSLTAVDLRGLTGLELAFAVLMIAGVTGLVLGLDLAERRRTFTILTALGARPRQLGAFLWSEGAVVVVPGAVLGTATGFAVASVLVALLGGAFDPPPESLSVPLPYLIAALLGALCCAAAAVMAAFVSCRKPDPRLLRLN